VVAVLKIQYPSIELWPKKGAVNVMIMILSIIGKTLIIYRIGIIIKKDVGGW
jgi:hypothetical protein